MAHGESHAKQTVLGQVEAIQANLSNGHKADPETHGAALLILIQMMKPIFNACLVTEDECLERMDNCPGRKFKKGIGWPAASAILGCFGMLVGFAWKVFI